jgi:hypothetical protein
MTTILFVLSVKVGLEEWMGVKRAEMYRQGKLTLTDLITKSGRQKTLEEL